MSKRLGRKERKKLQQAKNKLYEMVPYIRVFNEMGMIETVKGVFCIGYAIEMLTREDAPRFNRIGTLYLYSDKEDADDYYLYAINSDGTLRLIKDAWDDREEAFVITTRTLGQYVASADKLDIDAYNALVAKANASSSNAPTAPASSSNPENPYTGAYDFAGIAAVLALVSAGAIVVAKKR